MTHLPYASRREMLKRCGFGIGALAAASILTDDANASVSGNPLMRSTADVE